MPPSATALRSAPPGGTMSSSTTGTPALATWAAMPAPMTPAPITATLRISVIRPPRARWRCPGRRRCTGWPGRSGRPPAAAARAALPVMRAPVAPSGWPSAMAPPSRLTLAGSSPSSRMQASAWAAKASLSSTTSMSSTVMPGALPAPCAMRRHRADAHDLRRAAGDRDALDPRQRLQAVALGVVLASTTSTAAAPSVSGDEVPAVTVPSLVEGGLQPGQRLGGGVGRGCSRRARRAAPFAVDRHDLVSKPAAACCAAAAFCWLRPRSSSCSRAGDLVAARQVLGRLAHRDVGLRIALARGRDAASG